MGRDWDETGTGTRLGLDHRLRQFRTVFLSKKLAKIGLKSHIKYITPNFTTIFNFGSVAQSVARLLRNRKVPGSNPAEGGKTFSKLSLELDRTGSQNSCQFRPLGGAPVVAGKCKCKQILN